MHVTSVHVMSVHAVFQDATFRRFRSLRVRPEHFTSILTDSVGFSSYRLLTHTGEGEDGALRGRAGH